MAGAAKKKDLHPISDQILGLMRRFLLKDLKDLGGV